MNHDLESIGLSLPNDIPPALIGAVNEKIKLGPAPNSDYKLILEKLIDPNLKIESQLQNFLMGEMRALREGTLDAAARAYLELLEKSPQDAEKLAAILQIQSTKKKTDVFIRGAKNDYQEKSSNATGKLNLSSFKKAMPKKNLGYYQRSSCTLDKIDNLLYSTDKDEVACVILVGLPGMGKTQTATAFAYSFGDKYDSVIWFKASNNNLTFEFARLFSYLSHETNTFLETEEIQNIKEEKLVETIYKVLEKYREKVLFIFDNVDLYADIEKYIDKEKRQETIIHYLITSRVQSGWPIEWCNNIISLDIFTEEEAIDYIVSALKKVPGNVNRDNAKQLAELLFYFPLTIVQAVSYIRMSKLINTVNKFVDYYNNNQIEIVNKPIDKYELSLVSTWVSLKKTLQAIDPLLIQIIQICSCLYPDEIEPSILTNCFKKSDISKSIVILIDYALLIPLNNENNSFKIHRFLQDMIKLTDKLEIESNLSIISSQMDSMFKDILNTFTYHGTDDIIFKPVTNDSLIAHIRCIVDNLQKFNSNKRLLSNLIFKIIFFEFFVNRDMKSFLSYIAIAKDLLNLSDALNSSQKKLIMFIYHLIDTADGRKFFSLPIKDETIFKDKFKIIEYKGDLKDSMAYSSEDATNLDIKVNSKKRKIKGVEINVDNILIESIGTGDISIFDVVIRAQRITVQCKNNAKLNLINSTLSTDYIFINIKNSSSLIISGVIFVSNHLDISCDDGTLLDICYTYFDVNDLLIKSMNRNNQRLYGVIIKAHKAFLDFSDNLITLIFGLFLKCDNLLIKGRNIFATNIFLSSNSSLIDTNIYFLFEQSSLCDCDSIYFKRSIFCLSSQVLLLKKKLLEDKISLVLREAATANQSFQSVIAFGDTLKANSMITVHNKYIPIHKNLFKSENEASYINIFQVISNSPSIDGIIVSSANEIIDLSPFEHPLGKLAESSDSPTSITVLPQTESIHRTVPKLPDNLETSKNKKELRNEGKVKSIFSTPTSTGLTKPNVVDKLLNEKNTDMLLPLKEEVKPTYASTKVSLLPTIEQSLLPTEPSSSTTTGSRSSKLPNFSSTHNPYSFWVTFDTKLPSYGDNVFGLLIKQAKVVLDSKTGKDLVQIIFTDHKLVQQFSDELHKIGISNLAMKDEPRKPKVNVGKDGKEDEYIILLSSEVYNTVMDDKDAYTKLVSSQIQQSNIRP